MNRAKETMEGELLPGREGNFNQETESLKYIKKVKGEKLDLS